MTKTKHTPGPWVISHEYASQDDHVTIDAPTHGALAEVVWVMEDARLDGNRSPVCEANARLITAAPDLLEALRMVVESNNECIEGGFLTHEEATQINAAINKAEGGE